ncbi:MULTISPECIES: hypothetical protein [unclassified Sphingobacterium]|uniref:hypothetical protein n=1 Tax=unclassified Sphingobacterium TaxID=2609468 RepID=UPI0010480A5D|nr:MULTISPECIES: hypothetical protein [unclassified Sphingobacterium]MCS3555440.1 L-lactate permease [Sphingobacterium sp. JUb21]TCR02408.1 hypothetical protein EDF66_109203 [Sphingobacterium sp. JUb20]
MDLQQEWRNMSTEMMTTPQSEEISKFTITGESQDILQDLLFKLKWKFRWIRIIDLPILAFALFSERDLKILLIGVVILYEIFRWFGLKEFKKIKTSVDYSSSTKQVLENNLKAISKILFLENIWGYITAPIAAPIGFLCYKLTVHKSFSSVFELPNMFLYIILLIPLGILIIILGNLMNRSIFKEQIEDLRQKIKEIS